MALVPAYDTSEAHPRTTSQGCELIRVGIGWSLFLLVLSLLLEAAPRAAGDVPWTAAWIFYLPSLLTVFAFIRPGSRNVPIDAAHLVLGTGAAAFIVRTVLYTSAPPVPDCEASFSSYWLQSGAYCRNLFEARWGETGKVVPVAAGVLLTSLSHLVWRLAQTLIRR
ncbi:hypothetical protein [Sphingosinicella sp. BN140058]|uniref:hypothetical protein n=1 Tax=Sphingosinicella sp. BN140058 TaxID=1892855 RepID=UPI001010E243|nr:hypothetical protein [Sphingosinicella sp. BN140058]QAY80348.1 hypothetical protein ETR14_27280 [Sphingosinicella sp. BN140058]